MPKWLLWLLLILLLTIEAMHFISPGTIPDGWAIPIVLGVIAVTVVFVGIQRRKELDQIRDELQKLRQEVQELREKQQH
jgi:K+ transporter